MAEPTKPLAPVTSRRSPGFDSSIEFAGAFINQPEPSPPGGVALHPARIGCSAAAAAVARGGGETPLAPVGIDLDEGAPALALLDRRLRQPALHPQHTRPRPSVLCAARTRSGTSRSARPGHRAPPADSCRHGRGA